MGLVVPWPGVPQDGQPVEATTLAANLNAVYQAIQSFDASQIQAATLVASAFAAAINPNTILHDTISSFVQTGCVWSQVSGLNGTMTSGIAYIGNATGIFRVSVTGVGSNTFTASKDTYIDIDYNGNITYNAVANNAAAPALTANSIRVALVVTNGSAITSVTQTGIDSNNVQIYPTSPYGYGNWKSWTPTWTNLTVSGSTVTARYTQIGKTVYYRVCVVLGGGNVPTGTNIRFSLPVTSATYAGTVTLPYIGDATYFITNAYTGRVRWFNTTTAQLNVDRDDATYGFEATTSSTVPNTFTNGSEIHAEGFYEAA